MDTNTLQALISKWLIIFALGLAVIALIFAILGFVERRKKTDYSAQNFRNAGCITFAALVIVAISMNLPFLSNLIGSAVKNSDANYVPIISIVLVFYFILYFKNK